MTFEEYKESVYCHLRIIPMFSHDRIETAIQRGYEQNEAPVEVADWLHDTFMQDAE